MKKIFISYAWGSKEHQDWVKDLATRLMSDGIDVTFDRWSVKEGHDINYFMETMVKKDHYDKVIIISDKNYTEKANDRNGGVGIEAQIITPEIYADMTQEKFLPVVVERDDEDKPYLPTFLKSKLYFDFSNIEYFEESYENLVRNIYDAPQIIKPQVGSAPSYISENAIQSTSKTTFHVRALENKLAKSPVKVNQLTNEFLEEFKDDLYQYKLNFGGGWSIIDAGKKIVDKIHEYKPLREDFIAFMKIVTRPEYNLDSDILKSLFENRANYFYPREQSNSWYDSDYEHYKFIFHELFIYVIAICLYNQNYNLISDLLHSPYFFLSRYEQVMAKKYVEIREFPQIINDYYRREYNRISGSAELMISNLSPQIEKSYFIQADLLLHYVDELFNDDITIYKKWFPVTYFYKDSENVQNLFAKLISQKHFEKLKNIFNSENIEDFKNRLNEYKSQNEKENRRNPGFDSNPWDRIPWIYETVKINEIGKYK
ncbi:toll/interleukin-1 receptor domain-containing protein [Chryseobacterium koreense]